MISKKDVEQLGILARLEISEKEAEHVREDLDKILDHVNELRELDTERVLPMTGGTLLQDIVRADSGDVRAPHEAAKKAFPSEEKGFLKVPPVFE